jgi:hypothetical protein
VHSEWARLAGDDLLVIPGQEVVTGTGPWLALGTRPGQVVEWGYSVRDGVIGRHVSQVREAGGLCVAAHPHAPYPGGVFMYPLDGFDAVEAWNGLWSSGRPWNAGNDAATAEWGRALAAGVHGRRWLPAIGCSDTHLDGQIVIPHTVVLADELSTSAALAGWRASGPAAAGSPGLPQSACPLRSVPAAASPGSASGWKQAAGRPRHGSRLAACRRARSAFTPTGARSTGYRCLPRARAPSSGLPAPGNRHSSGSRCAIPDSGWRHSAMPGRAQRRRERPCDASS